jgi:indolepyruvate ferredoxin oxidoreductase
MMLAADLAVGAAPGVLDHCAKRAGVVGNLDLAATAAFKHDRDLRIDGGLHRRVIERATTGGPSRFLHAAQLSERLFGNAQAMNQLLLGMAWQLGQLPLARDSLFHAIELNGAAVSMNHRAFTWGRILADRPELAEQIMAPASGPADWSFAELVDHRAALLTAYQSRRYAALYRKRVEAVAQREAAVLGAPGALARAAAEGWFRVMYMKDEYEVARLHTQTGYEPARSPVFHLAPPLITRVDPATGRRRKIAISGRVALPLFRVLRHGRVLRGTVLDPFGRQVDRRMERDMIAAYEQDIGRVVAVLNAGNVDAAVRAASWPMDVRGYGPVKHAAWVSAEAARPELLAALDAPAPMAVAAE